MYAGSGVSKKRQAGAPTEPRQNKKKTNLFDSPTEL
jgi:hypothetical protein